MQNLNIKLEEPTPNSKIGLNQRFIIQFPGDIDVETMTKKNAFLVYDDMSFVWCNIAMDEDDNTKLFIYPSFLLESNNRITLQISDISFTDNKGESQTCDSLYWHFDIMDTILSYPDDPLIPTTTNTTGNNNEEPNSFEIVLTRPGIGTSNVPGNSNIEIVFNKDIDPNQNIADLIEISNTHVLL